MEYYSAKGGNPVICYNMEELENIMLSEIKTITKDKYCIIPLVQVF